MDAKPRISVVIPHLNHPDALRRGLAALAAQRPEAGGGVPFEIIVVDNGSRERPDATCAAFPFVRLAEAPEPGPGPARNRGARLARGAILAFIDADCIAAPDWIAAIDGHFKRHPEAQVVGGDVRIAPADPARATAIEAYESIYGYRMKLYVERDHYCGAGNMAVRRETFRAVGDFAGISVAEDMDWGRRATALGISIDYAPEIRIATPARKSFAELARKWDRHIAHDFEDLATRRFGRLRWAARCAAIAVSPLAELPRVLRSDRVAGRRERALAFLCLARIRLYRAWRMLKLLFGGDGASMSGAWNRQ